MGNDHWRTPEHIFKHWNSIFNFQLDAAANEYDTKCDIWIPPELDALTTDWCEITGAPSAAWCNPPYSQKAGPLQAWVKKFMEEASHGWIVVALLPADTSTQWWDLVWDRKRSCWKRHVLGHFLQPRVKHKLPPEGEPGYEEPRWDEKKQEMIVKKEGSPTWGSAILIFSKE